MNVCRAKKQCIGCGGALPLSEFYRHRFMADGHLNKCKECVKAGVRENRRRRVEYYREYDRRRGSRLPDGYMRRYTEMYPDRTRARTAVGNALRDGKLHRQPCEVCGAVERIHAHHDDYSKPFEVRWLCAAHHRQWHVQNGPGR